MSKLHLLSHKRPEFNFGSTNLERIVIVIAIIVCFKSDPGLFVFASAHFFFRLCLLVFDSLLLFCIGILLLKVVPLLSLCILFCMKVVPDCHVLNLYYIVCLCFRKDDFEFMIFMCYGGSLWTDRDLLSMLEKR